MFFLVKRCAAAEGICMLIAWWRDELYQKTTHFESCGKSLEKYWVIFMSNHSPQAHKLVPILQKHHRLNWTADHVNAMCGLNMKTRLRYHISITLPKPEVLTDVQPFKGYVKKLRCRRGWIFLARLLCFSSIAHLKKKQRASVVPLFVVLFHF